MTTDEQAIRDLVDTWSAATQAGDSETVLRLMTDDVIFMVPGHEPFGKEAFEATSEEMRDVQFEGTTDVKEIQVLGDWAYTRTYIKVTMTPPNGGAPLHRSGYSLSILRKGPDGQWRIARDANMLMVDA